MVLQADARCLSGFDVDVLEGGQSWEQLVEVIVA